MIRIVTLLFLLLPLVGQARIIKDYQTVYFDINPSGPAKIYEEIVTKHPVKVGFPIAGLTQTKLKWEATFLYNNSLCKIKAIDINVAVVYTIPKLIKGYNKSSRARRIFKKKQKKIMIHEKVHGSYSYKAALEMERAVLNLPEMKDCSEIEAKIDAVRIKMVKRLDSRNELLDLRDGKIDL